MKRRTFLAGCSATWLSSPALAADSAVRSFDVLRDGDPIGSHTLSAVRTSNGFEIEIEIKIAVKVLGITAYRYELANREVWQGGRLVSINSVVNDDGTDDFVKIKQAGDKLDIQGSRFTGPASGDSVTTSYYTPQFAQRKPWISTQSGALMDIQIKPEGRENWWHVTGELEIRLGYDNRGEWTNCEFDAGGEPGTYTLTAQKGEIAALWAGA